MSVSTLDTDLRENLLRWADSSRGTTAAVQLLIDHGFLPERLDGTGYLEQVDPRYARVNFRRIIRDLDECTGPLGANLSSSEESILRIAASLAGKADVNLGGELGCLDIRNARLVREAVARATGAWPA